jgi:hypothetical protein
VDDFQDASIRHLRDAELLLSQTPKRLANASHLLGLSAECSLKTIVKGCHPAAKFGTGKKSYGHFPGLFVELENLSTSTGMNASLVNHIAAIELQFQGWNVGQRYHAQDSFVLVTVNREHQGASDCHRLMVNFLEGLV